MNMWFISTGFHERTNEEIINDIMRGRDLLQTKFFDRSESSIMVCWDGITANKYFDRYCLATNHNQILSKAQNLANDIYVLGQCDGILFMKNWKEYRDCRIAHLVTKEYSLKILYEEELGNEKT